MLQILDQSIIVILIQVGSNQRFVLFIHIVIHLLILDFYRFLGLEVKSHITAYNDYQNFSYDCNSDQDSIVSSSDSDGESTADMTSESSTNSDSSDDDESSDSEELMDDTKVKNPCAKAEVANIDGDGYELNIGEILDSATENGMVDWRSENSEVIIHSNCIDIQCYYLSE